MSYSVSLRSRYVHPVLLAVLAAMVSPTIVSAEQNLIENGSFETVVKNMPAGWNSYIPQGLGQVSVSPKARDGKNSVHVEAKEYGAVVQLTTNLKLPPGKYRVSMDLCADDSCLVQAVIEDQKGESYYSKWLQLFDWWVRWTFDVELTAEAKRFTVYPRYARPWGFYVDNIRIIPLDKEAKPLPARSDRPAATTLPLVEEPKADRKKTLLFSCENMVRATHDIDHWASTGIDGLIVTYTMEDGFLVDIYANDKMPHTRGEDDLLWQEAKKFNDTFRKRGMTANMLKIPGYHPFPPLTDTQAWERIYLNCRDAGRFARTAGFYGIVWDLEYIEPSMYAPQGVWELDGKGAGLAQNQVDAYRRHGYRMMKATLEEFPEMRFMWLWEPMLLSANLGVALFEGALEAMAERNAPGGAVIGLEQTYYMADPIQIRDTVATEREWIRRILISDKAKNYWQKRGDVVVGLYPLGDEKGSWDAREVLMPIDYFRQALAAARSTGGWCTWIYGHGRNWHHATQDDIKQFMGKTVHKWVDPVDSGELNPQFKEFTKVVSEHRIPAPGAVRPGIVKSIDEAHAKSTVVPLKPNDLVK